MVVKFIAPGVATTSADFISSKAEVIRAAAVVA